MRWTTLRVAPEGIVLFALHRARIGPEGVAALQRFDDFCASAEPGIWSVGISGEETLATHREESRLFDGIPVRRARSPIAGLPGPIAKPAPDGPYAAVRSAGVATLLESTDGTELLESCSASIVRWDGARFLCVPLDRPRVDSVAERAIRAALPVIDAPFPSSAIGRDDASVFLLNAVVLCSPSLPGAPSLPSPVRTQIDSLFATLTLRP